MRHSRLREKIGIKEDVKAKEEERSEQQQTVEKADPVHVYAESDFV